jgi:hypothetical protein
MTVNTPDDWQASSTCMSMMRAWALSLPTKIKCAMSGISRSSAKAEWPVRILFSRCPIIFFSSTLQYRTYRGKLKLGGLAVEVFQPPILLFENFF